MASQKHEHELAFSNLNEALDWSLAAALCHEAHIDRQRQAQT